MPFSPIFEGIVGSHIMKEGGYANNPLDPGGETYKGIARRYNGDWRGWIIIDSMKSRDDFPDCLDVVADLNLAVKERYYEHYWHPMKLDLIQVRDIAAEMFDQGAGPNGISAAVKIAQASLVLLKQKVEVDGKMGPKTARALNTYQYTDDLVKTMNLLQWTHLLVGNANIDATIEMVKERLPQLREFARGWLKRIAL